MAVSRTRTNKAGVVIHRSLAIPEQAEVLYEVRGHTRHYTVFPYSPPPLSLPGLQIFPDAQLYSLSRVARHMDAARITSNIGVLTQLRAWYPRCAAEG